MDARLDFNDSKILQGFVKRLNAAATGVPTSVLPAGTGNLMLIRASQINGCSVCTDMHTKDAAHAGETAVRLAMVAAWRESKVFSPAERAALALTEEGTRLADNGRAISEDTWAEVRDSYDDDQIGALISLIATINAWNRLAIGFRAVPTGA